MTIRERITEQLDELDEAQLAALEEQLSQSRHKSESETEKQEKIRRQLEALRSVAGMLSNPEGYAEFEKHACHTLFGGRELCIEPDEASC